MEFIRNNISTIIVVLIIGLALAKAFSLIARNKREGRSSCGGNCGACPMAGKCHDRRINQGSEINRKK